MSSVPIKRRSMLSKFTAMKESDQLVQSRKSPRLSEGNGWLSQPYPNAIVIFSDHSSQCRKIKGAIAEVLLDRIFSYLIGLKWIFNDRHQTLWFVEAPCQCSYCYSKYNITYLPIPMHISTPLPFHMQYPHIPRKSRTYQLGCTTCTLCTDVEHVQYVQYGQYGQYVQDVLYVL